MTTYTFSNYSEEIDYSAYAIAPYPSAKSIYNFVQTKLELEEEKLPSNCKNCGAPLSSHTCEYCGTKY